MNWAAAAVMLVITTSAGAADEPAVLSELELDAVTAGGAFVDVGSFAAAVGDATRTHTDAKTFAFGGERFDLAVGFTLGRAVACCGEEAAVEVGSEALGGGDIVRGSTQAVKNRNRFLAQGLSVGFVVAASFDGRLATFRALRPALPDARGERAAAMAE